MEKGITKQQLIAELSRSPHAHGTGARLPRGVKPPRITPGDRLKEYVPIGATGAKQEPEFYSHLLSWNLAKGQVKDSRVALPVLALASPAIVHDVELFENALAHLAALDPRLFVRAMEFAKDQHLLSRSVRRLVTRYVRDREADRGVWDRTMLQHRQSMQRLYKHKAYGRIAPGGKTKEECLAGLSHEWNIMEGVYERDSVFAVVAGLKDMPIAAAARAISKFKISPLISLPALGAKAKDPDVLLELIKSMSPTELVTNMKLLEKLGARTVPMLRAALDEALETLKTSKKATLKTSQAARAVDDIDAVLGAKLRAAQEKQIDIVSSIEGNWAVLGDKSGSMESAIKTARQVVALLTRAAAKNEVHLVWFDASPTHVNLTGKTLDEIEHETRHVSAQGGTAHGVALNALLLKQIRVDGIVIVSDGGENQGPGFANVYRRYAEFVGKELPVYFFKVPGDPDQLSVSCNAAHIEMTTYDVKTDADYYSLPNLIQTMRVNHYSLLDEVMATPLLKLNDVLSRTTGMEVIKHVGSTQTVAG